MAPPRPPPGVIPSFGTRIAGIEGLRAIAALSIVLLHAWSDASPAGPPDLGVLSGFVPDLAFGVTLFFTLSGFLLYRPFVAALLEAGRRPSVRSYLRNRALRILPAYWVILLVSALLLRTVVVWAADGKPVASGLGGMGLLRDALFLQPYDPDTVATGIGPAWSLAVEVVFYLVLPVLAVLAFALARRVRSDRGRLAAALAPAALLLVLGVVGKAAAQYVLPPLTPFDGWEQDWHSVLERSFLVQADLFSFGMAVAVLRAEVDTGRAIVTRTRRRLLLAGALGAYLVTAKMTHVNEQLSYSRYNTLMAFGCAALVALVVLPTASGGRSPIVRVLELRPLVAAGLVSYSIFLWHHPLALWLREHALTRAGAGGFVVNALLLLAVTLAFSVVTYRLVEYPALKLKRRTVTPAAAASAEAAP
jgi:peptidoglycan/LPS O-acetylase OafA/YrhL